MQEEWKVYKETKSNAYGHRVYEVSNLGRVRLNSEIVEPYIVHGYPAYGKFFIHRAVAELFIPNPENKPFIDHINTIKTDNRVCNLRWVTQAENNRNPLTRKHNSESKKGRPSGMLGKVHTADTKRKLSEVLKGKTGKQFSEEHKRNISEALKEYYRKKRGN